MQQRLEQLEQRTRELLEAGLPIEAPPLPVRSKPSVSEEAMTTPVTRGKKVFIIHGRNQMAVDAMFQFLSAPGLEPRILTRFAFRCGVRRCSGKSLKKRLRLRQPSSF